MVIWLLFIPFIVGVLWILWNSFKFPLLKSGNTLRQVSVLVPLRNEEAQVGNLIAYLKNSHYEQVEYILYDDDSIDETVKIIQQQIVGDARFQLLRGANLPEGWKGKPHACQQLANSATGDILLWLDADVSISPTTIGKLVATMEKENVDALSGFPRFETSNWLERLLTPLLHFFVHMYLPIQLANGSKIRVATAASGAFIAIRREVYEEIGGHEAVKNEVIEDVSLFYKVKEAGYHAFLVRITADVSCSMYSTAAETWTGFEKNCFKAFRQSYTMGVTVIFVYSIYYIAPLFLAIYAVVTTNWLLFVPLLCITLQRIISDLYAKQLSIYSLLMPVSAFFYSCLLFSTMWKTLLHKKTLWKGREV